MSEPPDLPRHFLEESARLLCDVHLPRLARALEVLPEGDLEWRPHAEAISFGTILRHLEGNVRQWILAGLGGAEDRRRRGREFRPPPDESRGAEELLARLAATVREAAATLAALPAEALVRRHAIQGFDTTGLAAVLHVVEHFSWHTGQAVWIAKLRAGERHGIAFHDDAALEGA